MMFWDVSAGEQMEPGEGFTSSNNPNLKLSLETMLLCQERERERKREREVSVDTITSHTSLMSRGVKGGTEGFSSLLQQKWFAFALALVRNKYTRQLYLD